MFDLFELPIEFDGKKMLFPAELMAMGFTHKIKVNIDGVEVFFEPDEESNYRALITELEVEKLGKHFRPLLENICKTLDQLFGNGGQPSNTLS